MVIWEVTRALLPARETGLLAVDCFMLAGAEESGSTTQIGAQETVAYSVTLVLLCGLS